MNNTYKHDLFTHLVLICNDFYNCGLYVLCCETIFTQIILLVYTDKSVMLKCEVSLANKM